MNQLKSSSKLSKDFPNTKELRISTSSSWPSKTTPKTLKKEVNCF